MKKVLITGITGFVGEHLAKHLLAQNTTEIIGTYRSDAGLSKFADHKESITFEKVDLLNRDQVSQLIAKHKPQQVYHLAGSAATGTSFHSPEQSITNNILSSLSLLDVLKEQELKETRVMVVSSADIYGLVAEKDLPIDEQTELRPLNPYAVSKIAQDYLGLQYHLAYGLDIIRVRPFNHIGPGQNDNFVLPSFAKQIAEIEKKQKDPILSVGSLDAKRDFTDVRDMVRAYALLMEKGKTGEVYNIGSGESYQIKELLDMLLALTDQHITIQQDPTKLRPVDVSEFICDASKFRSLTEWKPEIPMEKTLQDILSYWRKRV